MVATPKTWVRFPRNTYTPKKYPVSCCTTNPFGQSFLMAVIRKEKSGLSADFSLQQMFRRSSSSASHSPQSVCGLRGLQAPILTLSTISEKDKIKQSCFHLKLFSLGVFQKRKLFLRLLRGYGAYHHTFSTEWTAGDVERPSAIYNFLSDDGKTVDVPFLCTISRHGLPQELRGRP